jgi:TonB-linked SusC/RagA family outer membrane protein
MISFAQTIGVSGVVTDETGESLPGVSISIPGTNQGVVSDIDGKYTINAASNGRLSFSYLGYSPQTVNVGGRTVINVVMKEDSKLLDEVVVIGYGTMKKSDLTGAVTSVKSDAIQRSVPTSLDQVLQGRAAGVQVQQNSGMPGASNSIRIRGTNSLNASNEPIYVIDGVIIDGGATSNTNTNTNALASINPADIVSMDILKDASATAIYGSRAANGVIVVTTKRGRKGEGKITYNGYAGFQQLPKKLDVLNLQEYAVHRNTLSELSIAMPSNSFVRPDLLGDGTDWQEELFTTALMHNHNLSISGGNDASTYNLSAGYLNQDGIAAGSGFERLNLTGSFDSNVKKWLKAGVNFAFNNINQDLTVSDQSLISIALRTTPDVPVRNADGSFAASDAEFMPTNPMAMASLVTNTRESYGIRANTYAEASIIEGLMYRTELSFDYNTAGTYRFMPTYRLSTQQFNETNEGTGTKQFNKYYNWRNILTYNRKFDEIHTINAMLGQEIQKSAWDFLSGTRTNYPTNNNPDLTLGELKTASNNGYTGSSAIMSYFGRVFYSLYDRYMLTATIRRDGSSKFAPEKRWGWFPSTALAWRISDEAFLKENETVGNLKLRLGWGLVGNQNISENYAYLSALSVVSTPFGSGLLYSNTANPDLTWESTSSSNVGIDLGLFKNRVELIADAYYKKTNNLLMLATLPVYSGTSGQGASSRPWVNAGSLENKGLEITLNTVNIENKNFSWQSNLIFSLNRNKVLSINTETGIDSRSVSDPQGGTTTMTMSKVGKSIGQFYGYQVIGRFENATDFYMYDKDGELVRTPVMWQGSGSDARPLAISEMDGVWIGDFIYKDVNGDGRITTEDLDFIGNPEPKFTYGIGNTFTYKNLDLTIMLSGSYGNDVVNYQRRWLENPRSNTNNLFKVAAEYAKLGLINTNGPNDYRNVQITGGDSKMPRMPRSTATSDYDFAFSDRYIEDGSYLRIQNISLGYTLPEKWTEKVYISNLKIFANLQNVYTFTKYKGYDPEIGMSYNNGNQFTGLDYGRYPSPRICTFGVNLTF